MARPLVLTLLFGGAALGAVLVARHVLREPVSPRRRPRGRRLADVSDVDGGPEVLRAMPDRWWTKRAPAGAKLCYPSKTDALNKFREWNQQVIDEYGGETAGGSRGEFDALTRHGALPKNIAEALWLALPPEKTHYGKGPFCIADIDVEALNETSAGQNHPSGFTLPEYVSEKLIDQKYQEHYADEG